MTDKITIEATIPTVQYGNVKPTIVIEGDDWETIRDTALKRVQEISNMTAGDGYGFTVRGLSETTGRTVEVSQKALETLTSPFSKDVLFFDNDRHIYTDETGERYTSSSAFPDKFFAPFDKEMILDAMVKKYPGVSAAEISAMWKLNSEASTGYGTAIHAALENFDRNRDLGEVIKGDNPNKALSKNPFIKQIVEWFHEGREKEDVLVEALVINKQFRKCGRIDRLKVVNREKKIVRVQDYKTDGNIHDKKYQIKNSPFKGKVENNLIGYHRLQLSDLAFMLKENGYTVEGTDIFWLNPAKLVKGENPWETFSHDVVDVSEGVVNG